MSSNGTAAGEFQSRRPEAGLTWSAPHDAVAGNGHALKDEEAGLAAINEDLRHQNIRLKQQLSDGKTAVTSSEEERAFQNIGRVVAGVAHDFKNLILGISGIVRRISDDLGPGNRHHEDLEIVLDATAKAGVLSKQLLSLGRRHEVSHQVLNLNQVIQGMIPLLAQVIGSAIPIAARLDPSLGNIKADKSQMERMLLNLAINARDAMPSGGTLTIETLNTRPELPVSFPACSSCVTLTVADTGIGMSANSLGRLFEPYFTTKDPSHGVGLGLATLKTIVEAHEGKIIVTSKPGQGTRFTIILPRVLEPVGYRQPRKCASPTENTA